MAIDWFPGHMLKARKEAVETLRRTDVVIEVLDARVPHSSCSPKFEALRVEHGKPTLKLLNKIDLADRARTKAWLAHYNARPGVRAIPLSAKRRADVLRIPAECLLLAPGRTTGTKPLRMMILGIPNVGKSTLMNTLLDRKLAKVGDEPAITKHQMQHQLAPNQWLVDTPGMLWPGVAQDVALKLAATHSIGRNAYDEETVATELGHYLLHDYRERVVARYGALPETADGHALLTTIAERRALLGPGGAPDLNKAAVIFLHEFRTGVLGPITLETIEQVAARAQPPELATV